MKTIYHLLPLAAWEDFKESGSYAPASLSSEGFIHFSFASQVAKVANRFYTANDRLWLLEVSAAQLGSDLVIEPPLAEQAFKGAPELFPHLYRALKLAEVVAHRSYEKVGGQFPELMF